MGHVTENNDLVTAKEAARIAKRDRRTISRWAESGRLPIALELAGAKKSAGRWFHRSDVERLAAEVHSPADEPAAS